MRNRRDFALQLKLRTFAIVSQVRKLKNLDAPRTQHKQIVQRHIYLFTVSKLSGLDLFYHIIMVRQRGVLEDKEGYRHLRSIHVRNVDCMEMEEGHCASSIQVFLPDLQNTLLIDGDKGIRGDLVSTSLAVPEF